LARSDWPFIFPETDTSPRNGRKPVKRDHIRQQHGRLQGDGNSDQSKADD
jgi:hypothetical protein